MPMDTRTKRASALGVGRPWMRSKNPDAAKGQDWRLGTGSFYAGMTVAPPPPSKSAVDVSPNFRKYLAEDPDLAALLTFDGEVHIHKSHAPQQDQMLSFANQVSHNRECFLPSQLAVIRPFIWYEQAEQVNPPCISMTLDYCNQPTSILYDVEVVSFDLDLTDAITKALERALCVLQPTCDGPACMAGMKVQGSMITGQSDEYEVANLLASDLGGFVRALSVRIQPYWW